MIGWAIETVLAVTVALLAVMVLRQPVARLFGPGIAYALWALPALRMVMPPLPTGGEALPVAPVAEAGQAMSALILADTVAGASGPPDAADFTATVLAALLAIWLAGTALFLAVQFVAYRRFRARLLVGAVATRSAGRGITLVESLAADGPMVLGVWRRYVIFPADPVTCFRSDEQAMALAHELTHHRRGDLLANVAALAMLGLLWWNPVAWLAYRAFRADQELACDADVLAAAAARGDLVAARQAYGRAIVKAASRRGMAAICHLNPVDILKRRLIMLADPVRSARIRRAGGLTAGLLVAGGLMLTASGRTAVAGVGADVARSLPDAAIPAIPAVPAMLAAAIAPPAPPAPPEPAAAVTPPPPVPPLPADAEAPPTKLRHGQLIIINRDGKRVVLRADRNMTLVEAEARAAERAAALAEARADGALSAAQRAEIEAQAEAEAAADRAEEAVEKGQLALAQALAADRETANVTIRDHCDKKAGKSSSSVDSSVSEDGKGRHVRVVLCRRAIAAEARSSALAGLERARDGLDGMPADVRAMVREAMDKAIASLKAARD